MEEFKAAVATAAKHTPGGRFNRDDIRGLQRLAGRLGISEREAGEVIHQIETGAMK